MVKWQLIYSQTSFPEHEPFLSQVIQDWEGISNTRSWIRNTKTKDRLQKTFVYLNGVPLQPSLIINNSAILLAKKYVKIVGPLWSG
jgi:hypothetical protein